MIDRNQPGDAGSTPIRPGYSFIWGREIPFRNPHFTGREAELALVRQRLVEGAETVIGQPALPVYGLGGIGKTEIAAEYAHRYGSEYDLVWWVRSEQEDTIRNSLFSLCRRLRLPDFREQDRDYSARLVLDALKAGDPYPNWLLIFDNAAQPEIVRRYIPDGTGHVIITSRISHWRRVLRTEGLEISEFSPEETIRFLHKRVPRLVTSPIADEQSADTHRLVRMLGGLPLAVEHCAAFLTETGTTLHDYLERFERNAHEMLGEDVDIYYPHAVATTWAVSRETISREADVLFKLLAFFAPEPVAEQILFQPSQVPNLPPMLGKVLGDRVQFRRAARELARFSLISLDGARNVLQVHRVVQAVTRGRIAQEDPAAEAEFRESAWGLLASSDPGAPDKADHDTIYQMSVQHLQPSGALESTSLLVHGLVINQVRRLHLRGGYREALNLGEPALEIWRRNLGADHMSTLALAVEVGVALRNSGYVERALHLDIDTLARLRDHHGDDEETTLICGSSYGADLRRLGRYQEALDHDQGLLPQFERVFRHEHERTLGLRNNIAVGLRCVGRYADALAYDQETYVELERTLGYTDLRTLRSKFAVARNLRRLGRYDESLDLLREVDAIFARQGEPWHLTRLIASLDFGVSLRRAGYYQDALVQGTATLDRYHAMVGEDHRNSMVAATNLVNDLRLTGDLSKAHELAERTRLGWEKVGLDHPNTYALRANLAIVLRARGDLKDARRENTEVLAAVERLLGAEHPQIVVVATNLASDLAALGEVFAARDLGRDTLEKSLRIYGKHPATHVVQANLALDLQACGDEAAAGEMRARAAEGFEELLGTEHPMTRAAAQGGRIDLDIEPMSA